MPDSHTPKCPLHFARRIPARDLSASLVQVLAAKASIGPPAYVGSSSDLASEWIRFLESWHAGLEAAETERARETRAPRKKLDISTFGNLAAALGAQEP